MIDLLKLKKGALLKLTDGRTLIVSGLYLSSDGPVVMAKGSTGDLSAENVPVSKIEEILKGD